jgi:hypothetical protein
VSREDKGASAEHVEVLSLGHSKNDCTKERWAEIFASYSRNARYHASNLAAHNWDVLLIDGRVFLCSYYGSRGHWLAPDATREDATDAEMAALYADPEAHPKERLFASKIEGGDVHD